MSPNKIHQHLVNFKYWETKLHFPEWKPLNKKEKAANAYKNYPSIIAEGYSYSWKNETER